MNNGDDNDLMFGIVNIKVDAPSPQSYPFRFLWIKQALFHIFFDSLDFGLYTQILALSTYYAQHLALPSCFLPRRVTRFGNSA